MYPKKHLKQKRQLYLRSLYEERMFHNSSSLFSSERLDEVSEYFQKCKLPHWAMLCKKPQHYLCRPLVKRSYRIELNTFLCPDNPSFFQDIKYFPSPHLSAIFQSLSVLLSFEWIQYRTLSSMNITSVNLRQHSCQQLPWWKRRQGLFDMGRIQWTGLFLIPVSLACARTKRNQIPLWRRCLCLEMLRWERSVEAFACGAIGDGEIPNYQSSSCACEAFWINMVFFLVRI